MRGAVTKTLYRAMTGAGCDPEVLGFALHGENPTVPMLDRFVARVLKTSCKVRPMCNSVHSYPLPGTTEVDPRFRTIG
jgi:hypothetical protein